MDYCWINNICTHSSGITYFSNGFSTNSNNNIADRCYVAFSFKWPTRYWRIVHVEFTVSETRMRSYHKPSGCLLVRKEIMHFFTCEECDFMVHKKPTSSTNFRGAVTYSNVTNEILFSPAVKNRILFFTCVKYMISKE